MKPGLEAALSRAEALNDALEKIYHSICSYLRPVHLYIALCIAFFFSTSGVIYNVLLTPPPYSVRQKPNGENEYSFTAPGMQSQYSMEGYVSGFLTTMGGICIVLATRELRKPSPDCGKAVIFAFAFCACAGALLMRFKKKTGFGSLL